MTGPAPRDVDVLLAESSLPEAELTLRALRELEPALRAEVARDGEEALDFVLGRGSHRDRAGAPTPKLVLLALRLPKVGGIEVLRTLRGSPRAAAVPVVVLSSAADPRELGQCYQAGANGCVEKPVDFPAFRETIRTLGRYWLGVNRPPPPPGAGV